MLKYGWLLSKVDCVDKCSVFAAAGGEHAGRGFTTVWTAAEGQGHLERQQRSVS